MEVKNTQPVSSIPWGRVIAVILSLVGTVATSWLDIRDRMIAQRFEMEGMRKTLNETEARLRDVEYWLKELASHTGRAP